MASGTLCSIDLDSSNLLRKFWHQHLILGQIRFQFVSCDQQYQFHQQLLWDSQFFLVGFVYP